MRKTNYFNLIDKTRKVYKENAKLVFRCYILSTGVFAQMVISDGYNTYFSYLTVKAKINFNYLKNTRNFSRMSNFWLP